jgi:hypothetical protein
LWFGGEIGRFGDFGNGVKVRFGLEGKTESEVNFGMGWGGKCGVVVEFGRN